MRPQETVNDLVQAAVGRYDRRPALLIKVPKVKMIRLSWIDQRGSGTSPRGDVEVILGEPILFDAGTDAVAATARLEAAVAAL